MNNYNIIPELNYWFKVVLKNSPVYDVYYHIPVQLDNSWRCSNSVIELLFNENFNPDPPTWMSSSSSSSSDPFHNIDDDNDRRYIYKYRRCNLNFIQDKTLLNRIQLYRWNANVFVANSEKFINILDMTGSMYDSTFSASEVKLPYDVDEKDRSPYITYESRMYFSSNYPLSYQPNSKAIIPPAKPPIITKEENVFDFTDQDLDMLDLLYDYKVGYSIDLTLVNYSDLTSCISKLIYVYLDAILNNNFDNYNNMEPYGTSILCSMYEKHIINILYMLKQKTYCINFNETIIVNEEEYRLDEDMLMAMKITHETIEVKQDDVITNSIILENQLLPWQRKDFTIFKDGLILEQDKDYWMTIDKTNVRVPFIKINFVVDSLVSGETLKIYWSYIDPYSAFSQNDN